MTGGFLCPLLYYPRNNAGALSQIKTPASVSRPWNLPQYPRNNSDAGGRGCKLMPLLCNLPQYPCKNPHKTFSYSCKEGTDRGRILQICYTTPVTSPARNTLEVRFLQKTAGRACHNTPVKIGGSCHNTPVKNGVVCHNTPVKVPPQTVANQTLNFLEIILERRLESRPADSPARAGGPCRQNRAYKGKGENKGRIFRNRTAGTVRPAGFWTL
jgi:hypothetical protein